ncbi:MAG: homogentisate 1,2-dioxygenase [Lautropia sp.]
MKDTQWNFAIPHFEGTASRQAHADVPDQTFERELGRDGFFGAATHMYHRNPPTSWIAIDGPVRPRAFNPDAVLTATDSPWGALELLFNHALRIRVWRTERAMDHLVRNADGDELLFVHRGAGHFHCDYGHMTYEPGDHLVVPRGTMWRLEPRETSELLMVEATGAVYRLPDRGIIGRHAPFDPGVFVRPSLDAEFRAQQGGKAWAVKVKRGGRIGTIAYPYNPLDAMGWKGDLYPVRLNFRDIRAVVSDRVHLPPSVRTTFVSDRFVVCSLVPRPMETDPRAMKLPFFHNNDDYDEFIFYHTGGLSSRASSFGPGMATYHPYGVTHGPSPEVLPYMFDYPKAKSDGYAVMVDALDALEVAALPEGCELSGYAESWKDSIKFAPDAACTTK